jgi:hypothetical protein
MGIFNFLKKSKSDTIDAGMELPPIPKLEGFGGMDDFPAVSTPSVPPLPDTMLPPLPTEIPTAVPPRPEEIKMEAPRMELPKPQYSPVPQKIEMQMPEPPEMEMNEPALSARPEFPSIPQVPSTAEDVVPDRIPPLEGMPEPPTFRPEELGTPAREESPVRRIEPEQLPHAFIAPEEPLFHKRRLPQGPMFIRTDQFKSALENIEMIRSKFSEEDNLFFRVNDVKSAQDQKYEMLRQSLEDVQRKLLFIDKSLFEAR